MANVLDRQFFVAHFAEADQKPTTPRLFTRPGSLSAARIEASQKPQLDAHDHLCSGGSSQDDALLISSDDESEHDDLDDSETESSLPPTEELPVSAKYDDADSNRVTSTDGGRNPTSSAGDDGNTKEPPVANRASTSGELATSQQQRSPAPSPAPALPRPSSASPSPLQTEQDQPVPVGYVLLEAGQALLPEEAVCGEAAEESPRAPPPGVEVPHAPSPGHVPQPSPLRLKDAADRESTPRRDSTSGSDRNDEATPPHVLPKSVQRIATLRQEIRRFRNRPIAKSNDEDAAEAVQRSKSRRQARRQDGAGAKNNNMYYSSSETDRGEDSCDIDLPPQKRRKRNSLTQPTPLRTATKQQIGPGSGDSRSQRVQTAAKDRRPSVQHNIPSSLFSAGFSDEEGDIQAPMAKYEEFSLENVVLKRTTVNSQATFQLQFTWDSCTNHRHGQLPTKRRSTTATRVPFTHAEANFSSV